MLKTLRLLGMLTLVGAGVIVFWLAKSAIGLIYLLKLLLPVLS